MNVIEKHSAWVRWTHWLNGPVLAIMIWSGLLIYWANDVYRPFFPKPFYSFFHLDHKLAEGMAVHFAFMWAFALNGLIYAFYLLFSGEWRAIAPTHRSPYEAVQVALHDFGLISKAPKQGKLNAAQRVAYTSILLAGLGSILTGIAIYKPVQFHWITSAFGGYENARLWHFIFMMSYLLFLPIHVSQVIRAGWENFRSMVAGFEIKQ